MVARVDDRGRAVARAVVDDEHLERARVILVGDRAYRVGDRSFLVVGRDEDRDAGIAGGAHARRAPVEQQARDQERVHESRHERDAADREPRERSSDVARKLADPG